MTTPEKTPEEKLRSEIGISLSKADYEKFSRESQEPLTESKKDTLPVNQAKFKTLPSREYIFTKLAYRNMLSIFVGIIKAYPALAEYAKSQGLSGYSYREKDYKNSYAMELYKESEIFYLATVER